MWHLTENCKFNVQLTWQNAKFSFIVLLWEISKCLPTLYILLPEQRVVLSLWQDRGRHPFLIGYSLYWLFVPIGIYKMRYDKYHFDIAFDIIWFT